jgi:hypothetical protein
MLVKVCSSKLRQVLVVNFRRFNRAMDQKKSIHSNKTILGNESGHAILEFAISLFFLGTLTMGIVDFGNVLNDYASLTEAAHQGARYGSGNIHLQSTTPISQLTGDQQGCPTSVITRTGPGTPEDDAHLELQERVSEVLGLNTTQLKQDSLCVTSRLENSGSYQNIVVDVQVAYTSMIFGPLPIKVQARAPYLHN